MSRAADAATFEVERPRLFGLAYRMLGTHADADDIVQEAWLRWQRTDDVERPAAWLTTVTSRLAIDRLRSAQRRRETYVGPWLPEPIVTAARPVAAATRPDPHTSDPAHLVELDESLTLGFLIVLDRLDPLDRAVFLLHDVFDVSYAEIADIVDRTEDNCRQIASRARKRVHRDRPAIDQEPDHRQALLDAFLDAVTSGDPGRLEPLLAADVVHISDGGPDRRAARQPVVGATRVSRLLANLAGRVPEGELRINDVDVNGQPGFAVWIDDRPLLVMEVEFAAGLATRVHAVVNPDKLDASLHLRSNRVPNPPRYA